MGVSGDAFTNFCSDSYRLQLPFPLFTKTFAAMLNIGFQSRS